MSPHSMERSAWNSTRWLWILLAICLIGWRVSSRVEQYHVSVASAQHQCQVTFFDSNERNLAAIDASRSQSRLIAKESDRLFPVIEFAPPAAPTYKIERESRMVFPPIGFDSVSLFSNPPPPQA